jgi:hypothetical protein
VNNEYLFSIEYKLIYDYTSPSLKIICNAFIFHSHLHLYWSEDHFENNVMPLSELGVCEGDVRCCNSYSGEEMFICR